MFDEKQTYFVLLQAKELLNTMRFANSSSYIHREPFQQLF